MVGQILTSVIDKSVNFVETGEYPGMVEARFVQRREDYFIVYLSSQTGCAMRCQMCHLTQTKQLRGIDVDLPGYLHQAGQVLAHYDKLQRPARVVHFNFMSRGEVLANRYVLAHADELVTRLAEQAVKRQLVPAFKFSTIMPRHTIQNRALTDIFQTTQPDIYYSVYSLDPSFRGQWLPNALDPRLALEKLAAWQAVTRKIPVLHWAYIETENDSEADTLSIARAVNQAGLRVDFNIVRYNPFDAASGREPAEAIIERNAAILRSEVAGSQVQVVTRVGFDVKASCGMFVA